MSEVSHLAAKVPALRRHAYLFTGSRAVADAAVETCLRGLPRDGGTAVPGQRPPAIDQATLHRHLHEVLTGMREAAPDPALPPRLRELLALSMVQRKLLLLVTLDHLPLRDAATILDLEHDHAAHELATARATFNAAMA